jgi:hypothetical protein
MTQLSLKERLVVYFRENYSKLYIASGELQRIVAAKTDYTPQNVGRRLRELESEAQIEVRYVKNHAHHRFKTEYTLNNESSAGLTGSGGYRIPS